jgi:transposase-like protein/DNA-directed RNA polymerase subunit RPC12/RpoP
MDAAVLEGYLRRGLSLEKIGELTGRHPSTVGYWVKQHGLSAVHRDRHAPKGGVDKETLTALVGDGLTTRQIAERLGFSQSTVRHWLRRYELRTHRARPPNSSGTRGEDPDRKVMTCARHGQTLFWLEGRGIYRCLRCRSEAVARRRRKLKEILVADAGGRCNLCGYDRYIGALQFHHRDGAAKDFGLADRGLTRSLEAVRAEAGKCILLCANCHSEVEGGIVKAA